MGRRARAYAQTIIDGLAAAPKGERHRAMRSAARRLYSMAAEGLLDPGEVTHALLDTADAMSPPFDRILDLLAWARAAAEANPELPEALR